MDEPDSFAALPTQPWSGPPGPSSPEAPRGGGPSPGPRPGRWQPPEPEQLQASFPQYEIRSVLGRGGMGAVYQGWQKSLRRLVAIKILPPGLEDNGANFAERFQREAQAMARFSHPGIVSVYDAGETADGLFYFVMEYIEGTDVQKMVKTQGPLPPEHALAITAHVCEALAYAHKRGVIHRDIKPANIMVDTEGHVKVADFGLAKVANNESATLLTGSDVSMGTPDFMAPETMLGMAAADHRADIYAVGAMLYQMLTGRLPRGRFEVPSRCVPGLDVRLDAIIECCLQPDPEKRYSSAAELHTELVRIQTSPTSSASEQQAAPDGAQLIKADASPDLVSGIEVEAQGKAAPGQRRGEIKARFRGCSFSLAIAFGLAVFAGSWIFRESQVKKTIVHPSEVSPIDHQVDVAPTGVPNPPSPTPTGLNPRLASVPAIINFDLSNEENRLARNEVLNRAGMASGLLASDRDKLVALVKRARKIGKVLTIPFLPGKTLLTVDEINAVKAELDKPQLAAIRDEPTAVFLVLGYVDARGDANKNLALSQSRAESVAKALRDRCGVLNVVFPVPMGQLPVLDREGLEKSQVVEIWVVLP